MAVLGVVLGASAAWAGSVTGNGSGPTNKDGCDAARANAASQVPSGTKVKKYSQCLCQGQSQRRCSVSAEF
jgi:hypothetical protein